MKETCTQALNFDPPLEAFRILYTAYASANYDMIITAKDQIGSRYFSNSLVMSVVTGILSQKLVLVLWKE